MVREVELVLARNAKLAAFRFALKESLAKGFGLGMDTCFRAMQVIYIFGEI